MKKCFFIKTFTKSFTSPKISGPYFVEDLLFARKYNATAEKGAAKDEQHVRQNGAEQRQLYNAYHSIFKSYNGYNQLCHVSECSV